MNSVARLQHSPCDRDTASMHMYDTLPMCPRCGCRKPRAANVLQCFGLAPPTPVIGDTCRDLAKDPVATAWPVDLLFGRLALDASTARPMWLPSSQRQDFQCEEHEVGVSTFSHSRQVLSCQDSQNKLPICQGVSCPDCRLQDSHSQILDRWTQRFCLKAISSKTECDNLVSPPLDGLIRWESVERRTRNM